MLMGCSTERTWMRVRPQRQHEMAVGSRGVHGPEDAAAALTPVGTEAPAEPAEAAAAVHAVHVRIHEASEDVFGFFPVVGRDGKIVVLKSGVFAPGLLEILERGQNAEGRERSH